jgi:hypothetical protein
MHIYERQQVFTMGYLREPDPPGGIPSPIRSNQWPEIEKEDAMGYKNRPTPPFEREPRPEEERTRPTWPSTEKTPAELESAPPMEAIEQLEERHWWGNIIRTFGKDK